MIYKYHIIYSRKLFQILSFFDWNFDKTGDIVITIDSRNFHLANVHRLALFEDKTNDTVTLVHHD